MIRARHAGTRHENGEFQRARARERIQLLALRGQAARTVAQQSADADDCRRLLSMLGLDEPLPAVPPADGSGAGGCGGSPQGRSTSGVRRIPRKHW